MKTSDSVALAAVLVSAATAIFAVSVQFDLSGREHQRRSLERLRSEIIAIIDTNAKCYRGGDLIDYPECHEPKLATIEDPLVVASKIRVALYKEAHLFTPEQRKALLLSGDFKPFRWQESPSHDLDDFEFIGYASEILDVLDNLAAPDSNERNLVLDDTPALTSPEEVVVHVAPSL